MNSTKKIDQEQDILKVNRTQQYKTVEELFIHSQPSSVYYTLLTLSGFIVACGLLLNNAAIVIGGMLVTPVLTPLLLIALALSVGEPKSIKSSAILIGKSAVLIVGIAIVMALLFGSPRDGISFAFDNSLKGGVLYFIVAVVSGVAATFAWVHKEVAEKLPGIAVSVSLVPPLSLLGIGLSTIDLELAQFSFLVFLFNLAGVILGSMVVFSLLKFYRTQQIIQKEEKSVAQKEAQHLAQKQAAKKKTF